MKYVYHLSQPEISNETHVNYTRMHSMNQVKRWLVAGGFTYRFPSAQ